MLRFTKFSNFLCVSLISGLICHNYSRIGLDGNIMGPNC